MRLEILLLGFSRELSLLVLFKCLYAPVTVSYFVSLDTHVRECRV